MTDHYDVIVIGSGAGGGTLTHALAPTGKRILLLERGGFLPREPQNWDSTSANPTLTIIANALCVADHITEQLAAADQAQARTAPAPSVLAPGASVRSYPDAAVPA
jgi:choline dehydrogenase-like flavoprotein